MVSLAKKEPILTPAKPPKLFSRFTQIVDSNIIDRNKKMYIFKQVVGKIIGFVEYR